MAGVPYLNLVAWYLATTNLNIVSFCSVYISVRQSVFIFVCLSALLLSVWLSLYICLSVYLCLSACLCACLSFCLSVCLLLTFYLSGCVRIFFEKSDANNSHNRKISRVSYLLTSHPLSVCVTRRIKWRGPTYPPRPLVTTWTAGGSTLAHLRYLGNGRLQEPRLCELHDCWFENVHFVQRYIIQHVGLVAFRKKNCNFACLFTSMKLTRKSGAIQTCECWGKISSLSFLATLNQTSSNF